MIYKIFGRFRDLSIPLLGGVVLALIWANISPDGYHEFMHNPIFGETISLHWLVNDIFMVFFFAIAGVEIVNSLSAGGALNPIRKAVTPLMATAGGVIGPVGLFFLLNVLVGEPAFVNGWGICTATDIALAWLIARMVFGRNHPAVKFLLLLAVADDAIGLIVIAVFYPDPNNPVEPMWLLLVVAAIGLAYFFNKKGIKNYWVYIIFAGTLSWFGMHSAHLHPALSLIFIVPFLPKTGEIIKGFGYHNPEDAVGLNTLATFEHQIAPFVDYGLVFFGLTNAGVSFAGITDLTWIILVALIVGKTVGISLFTYIATLLSFKLPDGMQGRDVIVAGIIGGMGLTVALFVANEAFVDLHLQGAAKMGALFTAFSGVIAIVVGKLVRVKKVLD